MQTFVQKPYTNGRPAAISVKNGELPEKRDPLPFPREPKIP